MFQCQLYTIYTEVGVGLYIYIGIHLIPDEQPFFNVDIGKYYIIVLRVGRSIKLQYLLSGIYYLVHFSGPSEAVE